MRGKIYLTQRTTKEIEEHNIIKYTDCIKKEKYLRKEKHNMNQVSEGCKRILQRMVSRRIIGGKHLPETICLSWIKNLPKQEYKQAIWDLEECIKEGLVLTKPKPSQRHFFLNPHKIEEIKKLIGVP